MSNDNPEAIRADIEQTRRELGQDVDALADKVNPSKAMHRQTSKVTGAFRSARERIMGAMLCRFAGYTLGAIVENWSVERMENWAAQIGDKNEGGKTE